MNNDAIIADLRARIAALETADEHRDMLQIMRICLSVGDCPPIANGDHYVVRLVKQLALSYNQLASDKLLTTLEEANRVAQERYNELIAWHKADAQKTKEVIATVLDEADAAIAKGTKP